MDAKISRPSVMRNRIFASSQSISSQDFYYKGKTNNFTVEKPGRHTTLTKRSKLIPPGTIRLINIMYLLI